MDGSSLEWELTCSLGLFAEEGLMEEFEMLAFLVLFGVDYEVSSFSGTMYEESVFVFIIHVC